MAEKCAFLNMSFWVKYLLETVTYKRQGLRVGSARNMAKHCKQKEVLVFHVEQFLFVQFGAIS